MNTQDKTNTYMEGSISKFKKIIPYIFAASAVMSACKKPCSCDKSLDADDPRCCEVTPPAIPPVEPPVIIPMDSNDRMFYFGPNDMSVLDNTQYLQKVSDSASTKTIYIISLNDSYHGMPLSGIVEKLRPVYNLSKKMTGGGNIVGTTVDNKADSVWAAYQGYTIVTVPKEPYDVTYWFGPDNQMILNNSALIQRTTDSALVKRFLLKSDGRPWNGAQVSILANQMRGIYAMSNKIAGDKTELNNLLIDNTADSTWLARNYVFKNSIQPHVTVYTFGPEDNIAQWDITPIWLANDSVAVKKILLRSNGNPYNDMPVSRLAQNLNMVLNKSTKIYGDGVLNGLTINDKNDSAFLANKGFSFVNCKYPKSVIRLPFGFYQQQNIGQIDTVRVALEKYDTVILSSISEPSWPHTMTGEQILENQALRPIFTHVLLGGTGRVKGKGIINGLNFDYPTGVFDSLELVKYGFIINNYWLPPTTGQGMAPNTNRYMQPAGRIR